MQTPIHAQTAFQSSGRWRCPPLDNYVVRLLSAASSEISKEVSHMNHKQAFGHSKVPHWHAFPLSFFKYFSYRQCISQSFFTGDCRKHKRKSLHHFMSCQHLIKVRYHALEQFSAYKLDRATGPHLGARASTQLFQPYHIPPLFYGDCMGKLRKGCSMPNCPVKPARKTCIRSI